VLDLLAHHDITPEAVVHLPDHVSARQVAAAAGRVVTARPPDLWLCTSKCVTRLPARLWGGPVASIDYRLALPRTLALALAGVCGDASPSHA
jgi:hypothetical protein